ncbi:hypothetical protein WA158_006861 [Blastocystis sp. Blastoise]
MPTSVLLHPGNQKCLSDDEEKEIVEWIKECIRIKKCPTKVEISEEIRRRSINNARRGNGVIKDVSEAYVRNLLKKYDIQLKKPLTNYVAKVRPTVKDAKTLYRNIHYIIKERNIHHSLIYNMDESWVTCGEKRLRTVVAVTTDSIPITDQGTSVTHTTLIGCICSDETCILSSYIVDKSTYNKDKIKKEMLEYLTTWFYTKGWINKDILSSWLLDV